MIVVLAGLLIAAQATQPAAAAAPDKKICRAVGPSTGSILGRAKECHTKSEWAVINEAKADSANRFNETRNRNVGMAKESF